MAKNWRETVDPSIRGYLEMQIREAGRHKNSYRLSDNPSNGQLWIAIANLSKQIFDINLKLNYLERALRDISGSKQTKEQKQAEKKTKRLVKSLKKL